MPKPDYVIYIPGLGDSHVGMRTNGQRLAMNTWRLWGVRAQLFQMNWADNEGFEPKFKRLLALIDSLAAQGRVSLVCASAGATAAMNAYAARPNVIQGVVCIAGKINNPQAISHAYKTKNPAFWESAHASAVSLPRLGAAERQRILSIRGIADPIVPARDSILEGAHNKVVGTAGHGLTIGTQLIFGAPSFLRFLQRQNSHNQV